jgi:hypothetical protein
MKILLKSLVYVLLFTTATFAADTKITSLPEETVPVSSDILLMVDDPGGLPVNKKVQIGNLGQAIGPLGAAVATTLNTPKVLGGTATTQDLDFQTTSGVGGAGADMHFKVGSNGGTEAMTILNSGNVGIGTSAPVTFLHIRGGSLSSLPIQNVGVVLEANASAAFNIMTPNTERGIFNFGDPQDGDAGKIAYYHADNSLAFHANAAERMRITSSGNVGIGTTTPDNPLAVNRSDDGVIVDFESADTVEGNVSISGNTTSYNAFVGSHYTQLKDSQAELPVGAVVVSTGEIIPCSVSKQKYTQAPPLEAVTIIDKADAVEAVDVEVEDKDNIISEETTYAFDPETGVETPTTTYKYGTKTVHKKRLKDGACFHEKTRQFYTINPGYVTKDDKFYLEETVSKLKPNKEYFVYVDTTSTAADKRAYGVWLGKMSDDAKGMSFGKDSDPVYLVAQVGLFKCRVTNTNGNIANGDYLETSTRPMEAQKQTSAARLNSTIAKSMVDVDWSTVPVDVKAGYKWRLIPCTF